MLRRIQIHYTRLNLLHRPLLIDRKNAANTCELTCKLVLNRYDEIDRRDLLIDTDKIDNTEILLCHMDAWVVEDLLF